MQSLVFLLDHHPLTQLNFGCYIFIITLRIGSKMLEAIGNGIWILLAGFYEDLYAGPGQISLTCHGCWRAVVPSTTMASALLHLTTEIQAVDIGLIGDVKLPYAFRFVLSSGMSVKVLGKFAESIFCGSNSFSTFFVTYNNLV